jgi:hypothetical protein
VVVLSSDADRSIEFAENMWERERETIGEFNIKKTI